MLLVLTSGAIVINWEYLDNKIQTQGFDLWGSNWKQLLVSEKGFVFNSVK